MDLAIFSRETGAPEAGIRDCRILDLSRAGTSASHKSGHEKGFELGCNHTSPKFHLLLSRLYW